MACTLRRAVWILLCAYGMLRLGEFSIETKSPWTLLISRRTCLALLQGHTALVCQLQFSQTMLVTGGSDGRVITFALKGTSFAVVQRIAAHDSSVTGLQLDERFLVTGGNDGRVRLFQFDRETGRCEYVRELTELSESVWKVAYTRETCAIMCKRGGKTVMEIWSFKPMKHELEQ